MTPHFSQQPYSQNCPPENAPPQRPSCINLVNTPNVKNYDSVAAAQFQVKRVKNPWQHLSQCSIHATYSSLLHQQQALFSPPPPKRKITERLLTAHPVINTTINQEWPLVMIMEEVTMMMRMMEKVQEDRLNKNNSNLKRRKKNHPCCDVSRYHQQSCRSDFSPAMPVV